MSKHRECLRQHVDELLNKPDVYAVGIGEKISKGRRTGKRAIICSIKKKKASAQLTKAEMIPQDLDGIPTDIVEVGDRPRAFPAYQDKQRPVVPGCSTGHVNVTAGTIGAVVEVAGEIMLLSNNHVFADENDASLGDTIIQPGSVDGGRADRDRIGTLYTYVPVTFNTQDTATPHPGYDDTPLPDPEPPEPEPPAPEPEPPAPPPEEDKDSNCPVAGFVVKAANRVADFFGRGTRLKAVRPQQATAQIIRNKVDGALIRIDPDISYVTNYLGYYSGVKGINELAGVGTAVHKLGRTTGHTNGEIVQTDVVVDVMYGNGIVRFEDQIAIRAIGDVAPFSAGGDSGSIIVDSDDKAVALLFAGDSVTTYANPIDEVVEQLKITRFVGDAS